MKYDTQEIKLTPRFIEALKEIMWAEMEMMRINEPENAGCWTWGICRLGDIATNKGISFEFGGEEDKPADFPEWEDTWIKEI